MALGPKQQQKYEKILRNQGKKAANEYRASINSGAAPSSAGSSEANLYQKANKAGKKINPGNTGSVATSQRAENIASNQYNAPNVADFQGSRSVTFDNQGRATATTQLTPEQQNLFNQQNAFRGGVNSFVGNQMGQYQGFTPGNYSDPRSGQQNAFAGQQNIYAGQQNAFAGQQSNFQGQQNPLANRQSNFKGQQSLYQAPQQLQNVPNYEQVQNEVTQRAIDIYDRNTSKQIAESREAQIQQLVNSGNGPGSPIYEKTMRNFEQNVQNARSNAVDQAYISGQNATNAAYQSQLAGNQQGFQQNFDVRGQNFQQAYAGNDQRFNQLYANNQQNFDQVFANNDQRFNQLFANNEQKFGQIITNNDQRFNQLLAGNDQKFNQNLANNQLSFNQNIATNDQRFNQQYATSMAPIEAARAYLPYAGQFTAPNYGPLQQFNVAPVNTSGIAAGIYGNDTGNAARLGAAGISAGATTAAAGIGANATIQAQQLRGNQALEQIAAQSALAAGL